MAVAFEELGTKRTRCQIAAELYLSRNAVKSHTCEPHVHERPTASWTPPRARRRWSKPALALWSILFAFRKLVIEASVFHPGEKCSWVMRSHPEVS